MEAYQIVILVVVVFATLVLIVSNLIFLAKDKKKKAKANADAQVMKNEEEPASESLTEITPVETPDETPLEEKAEETPSDELPPEPDDEADVPAVMNENADDEKDETPDDEEILEGIDETEIVDGTDVDGNPFALLDKGDDGDGVVLESKTKRIYVMYNRSFTSKVIQAEQAVKARYSEIKNEILSYAKAKGRVSWTNETFSVGRKAIAKFAVRGKTLSLYLALDPTSVAPKYYAQDVSDVKRYAGTPTRLRLRSDRSVKYARELIALAMKEVGAEKKESEKIDYVPDYESTEALVKRGLIKLLATDEVGTEVVNASFTDLAREKFKVVTGLDIRPSVSVEEAKEAVSDEIIEGLIIHEKDVFVHHGNKKGIVNIDSLSASFADGDVVDIIALKQKGLIAKNVGYVKVLARGTLNKALTVKAHEYSTTAVKMIMLVGGAVVEED